MRTLNDYTVKELKKAVSKSNIKRYAHLNKPELIKLMLSRPHYDKFKHMHDEPKKNPKIKKSPKVQNEATKEKKPYIKIVHFEE